MNDDKIIELCLSRDENAIAEMAAKYGAALRSIAYGILKDRPEAEECENDAYLEAWRLIPPNEPRGYLFAFLGRIVRHIAIDRCRSAACAKRSAVFCELTREMEECLPDESGADCRLEAAELTNAINRFLASKTEEQRNIFLRRYWYFDTVAEIAARYGVGKSKVKTALFRMRRELKDYLEKEGYEI